jgi:hypothetical protein
VNNTGYGKLAIGLLGAWLVGAVSAAALHVFNVSAGAPPIAFGLAVITPIALFLLLFRASSGFRNFLLSLNPRVLTYVQSWRVAGFVFLALYVAGALPREFAFSAGWGDITIGATASLVALKLVEPRYRSYFILWNVLGMVDLVTAIAMGTLTGIINPHAAPTSIMTILPMSLIPTFVVPLFAMLHVISIAQALRWKQVRDARSGEAVPA